MTTAKKATAADTLTALDEAVAVSKQTVENVVKAGADAASKGYEKAVALSKEQMDAAVKAGDGALKRYEDVLSFQKDTLDAFVASSTILVKGWQDVTKAMIGFAQASVDDGIAHSKTVTGVKSVHELIELNQGFAKTSMDKAVTETSKLSEMSMALLKDASAPLSGRFEVALDKFMKPVAA